MKINEKTRSFMILVAMVALAYYFWDFVFMYPVKLFVVVLHEMSHGIAAVICGGRIEQIQIDPQIGGFCRFSMPDNPFFQIFVASTGYLGSIFWGALILIIAARTRYDRYVSLVIGLIVLMLTVFFIREVFGIIFCLSFSIIMLLSYKYMPDWFNDYAIKFLGMASCLYAIVDIKDDLIVRSGIGSDADAIARLFGIPQMSVAIGVIWIIISLTILVVALKIAGEGENGGSSVAKRSK